jgi:hypothetical protein
MDDGERIADLVSKPCCHMGERLDALFAKDLFERQLFFVFLFLCNIAEEDADSFGYGKGLGAIPAPVGGEEYFVALFAALRHRGAQRALGGCTDHGGKAGPVIGPHLEVRNTEGSSLIGIEHGPVVADGDHTIGGRFEYRVEASVGDCELVCGEAAGGDFFGDGGPENLRLFATFNKAELVPALVLGDIRCGIGHPQRIGGVGIDDPIDWRNADAGGDG